MDGNRAARLLALMLVAAIVAAFYLAIFTDPKSTAQPAGKPRKLAPAEQRDSLDPERRAGKG